MKSKLDRVISIATLVALLVAIFLFLQKPAPVAQPAPAAVNAQSSNGQSSNAPSSNAQSLSQKTDQLEPVARQGQQAQTGGGYSLGSSAAAHPGQNSSAPQTAKSHEH
jgi:hypothetical protein